MSAHNLLRINSSISLGYLLLYLCMFLYSLVLYIKPPFLWCYTFGIVVYFVSSLVLCVLYFSGTRQGQALGVLTWSAVVIWYSYAKSYQILGLQRGDAITNDFGDCLYFSIVTWTTLGYGDLLPTPNARLYAGSEAVIGIVYMGLYVSLLTSYLSNREHADQQQNVKRKRRRRKFSRRLIFDAIREYDCYQKRNRSSLPPRE